ncbi:type VI secretion system ImpA family N-terminal domain-containing protein [Pantoea sp. BRR-3P]|uniref:type VI secretion system protein TssA n=1 Tax=Pantoea sp. BRR-3P TaxID=3141541 RepID=UPI0031F4E5FB
MSDLMTPMCPEWYQPLLMPVTDTLPCGENLEDDAAFLLLETRMQPRMGAEYGDFVETVDPINWGEIEREVKTLLTRSLDLRLVLVLIRCRFRKIGIPALDEGLCALLWLLKQWPEQVHPQLYDEGSFEPLMRANVLAELESSNGILADLRMQPLPKVSGLQLNVRDVERATLNPQAEQSLDENALSLARLGWQEQQADVIFSLRHAEQHLNQLRLLLIEMLSDDAPDFSGLFKVLALFGFAGAPPAPVVDQAELPEVTIATPAVQPLDVSLPESDQVAARVVTTPTIETLTMLPVRNIQDRTDALMRLREIQQWFVRYEPSSPVGDLLTLTEQMVGKRFAELMQILPQDLIARLSNGQES